MTICLSLFLEQALNDCSLVNIVQANVGCHGMSRCVAAVTKLHTYMTCGCMYMYQLKNNSKCAAPQTLSIPRLWSPYEEKSSMARSCKLTLKMMLKLNFKLPYL